MQGTVRKNRNRWQALINVRDSGTKKRRQLSATFDTKADAERWLALTAGRFGFGDGVAHSMVVSELLETWFNEKSPDWSPSNRRNIRNVIDRVINPRFGDTPVLKLKAADLGQWYASLRRTLSPSTIRKYHNVIHSAYVLAENYEWVVKNPARSAKPPKISRTPIDPPTVEEMPTATSLSPDTPTSEEASGIGRCE